MKILMIVPHYAPDHGPSAPLFTMLSNELVKQGHQVIILAAVPHYPTGIVPEAYRGKFIQRALENGMEVFRIRVPSVKRSNFAGRMTQYLAYQIGAAWAGLTRKYDVVFVANPALWVWLPFAVLCVLRRKPSVYSVYDVYPDVGIRLGIFRNKWVIRAVKFFEQYCLSHATVVRIISESFKPGMRRLDVPAEKTALIYDWVDTDLVRPLPKENAFRVEHGLSGRFVVLYAGNLGLSQGLETILSTAEQLTGHPDIQFVFVGDGAGRENLMREAGKRALPNVQFIPYQPRERLPEVLASADVSLVILKTGIGFDALPSKLLSILASHRPVVASVDEGCETWDLLHTANAGVCVPPESPAELARAILSLKGNEAICHQMGQNGRAWALAHHSPQAGAKNFEKIFQEII